MMNMVVGGGEMASRGEDLAMVTDIEIATVATT